MLQIVGCVVSSSGAHVDGRRWHGVVCGEVVSFRGVYLDFCCKYSAEFLCPFVSALKIWSDSIRQMM